MVIGALFSNAYACITYTGAHEGEASQNLRIVSFPGCFIGLGIELRLPLDMEDLLLFLLHAHVFSGLLLMSQLHNASQLSAWCLHFISSNYVVFKEKEEFSQLVGDNMDYINQR